MWVFLRVVGGLYANHYRTADESERAEMDERRRRSQQGHEAQTASPEGRADELAPARLRLGDSLLAFGYWILFSLLAIAFDGNRPYVALAVAVVGGVVFGFLCLSSFDRGPHAGPIVLQKKPNRANKAT